jgi:hypothetical protein
MVKLHIFFVARTNLFLETFLCSKLYFPRLTFTCFPIRQLPELHLV